MTHKNILSQFIGLEIQKVTYFELNDPSQPFFFDNFDNCDLGIEIEFSNWSYLHIGWKNDDHPEIGLGKYDCAQFEYSNALQFDATSRWSKYLKSPLKSMKRKLRPRKTTKAGYK